MQISEEDGIPPDHLHFEVSRLFDFDDGHRLRVDLLVGFVEHTRGNDNVGSHFCRWWSEITNMSCIKPESWSIAIKMDRQLQHSMRACSDLSPEIPIEGPCRSFPLERAGYWLIEQIEKLRQASGPKRMDRVREDGIMLLRLYGLKKILINNRWLNVILRIEKNTPRTILNSQNFIYLIYIRHLNLIFFYLFAVLIKKFNSKVKNPCYIYHKLPRRILYSLDLNYEQCLTNETLRFVVIFCNKSGFCYYWPYMIYRTR